METREVLSRIIGLFTAEELKALGKQIDLKGISKMNKGDLIKAIITQTPEEAMGRLVSGEGKRKIQETIKNALALLGGASIATERLGSIKIQGDDVVAKFDGMRWTTQCSMRISHAGVPEFDHVCTCKASESGALCVHFWATLLRLLSEEMLPIAAIGPFVELAGDAIESGLKSVKPKVSRPIQDSGDARSKPIDQLLQSWTIEGRYERSLDELGRGGSPKVEKPAKPEKPAKAVKSVKPAKTPAALQEGDVGAAKPPRKAKKPPAEPYHIEVRFSKHELGPPAKIVATLVKVTGEGKETLPFHILIDEARQVVAHDGCMDFDMRLRRKQLLCKHLLQVFVSIDEQVARRLLGNLGKFEFTNIIPSQKDAPLTLPDAIQRLKPDVRVADNDALKGAIMNYLLANEGSPDKLGIDAIKANAGDGAAAMLPTMVAEGMLEEFSPGHFRPK
jgi:hypothetical protein